jgi:hypothetical protein
MRFLPALLVAFGAPAFLHAEPLQLSARERPQTAPGQFTAAQKTLAWDPQKTALVICDMWDHHTCPNAEVRVGEMAPRANEFAKAARAKGVLIIHCPSDTMEFYKDHPGRKLAQSAPKAEPKAPLERWCRIENGRPRTHMFVCTPITSRLSIPRCFIR